MTKKEVTTGSTGAATSNTIYPRLMNAILGTKFKIMHGYINQPPIFLAMERGELEGAGGPFYSSLRTTHPEYLRDNKVTIIVQIALEKHPDLPNVPLLLDFAKTQEDRQEIELAVASLLMGRPYVLPEGVPADRVKILQDSFMETMKDPALLQEAQKLKLEINAIDGPAVHALLAKMYTPAADHRQGDGDLRPQRKITPHGLGKYVRDSARAAGRQADRWHRPGADREFHHCH